MLPTVNLIRRPLMNNVASTIIRQRIPIAVRALSSLTARSSIQNSTCRCSSKCISKCPCCIQIRKFSEGPSEHEIAQQKTQEAIKDVVTKNRVVLFMKGNPIFPNCGFSRTVVEILKREGFEENDYIAVDCLQNEFIREGIKTYSEWPTIPQLYVDGEFVGGCDILSEMYKNAELKDVLKKKD